MTSKWNFFIYYKGSVLQKVNCSLPCGPRTDCSLGLCYDYGGLWTQALDCLGCPFYQLSAPLVSSVPSGSYSLSTAELCQCVSAVTSLGKWLSIGVHLCAFFSEPYFRVEQNHSPPAWGSAWSGIPTLPGLTELSKVLFAHLCEHTCTDAQTGGWGEAWLVKYSSCLNWAPRTHVEKSGSGGACLCPSALVAETGGSLALTGQPA